MAIKSKCDGPCGEPGKTLYPVFIEEPSGKKVEKMYCLECSKEHSDKVEEAEIQVELLRQRIEDKIISGVPKVFVEAKFDDYISSPVKLTRIFSSNEQRSIAGAKEITRKFLESVLSGEYEMMGLIGGFGTGKTLLAAICANEIMKSGGRVKFEKATLLCRRLMNNEQYEKIIIELASNDLIIIDDISNAVLSDFTRNSLSDVIDAIKENQKSLIVTSNSTEKDIKNYIGERGYDRIQESPNGGFIRFKWGSFRGTSIQSRCGIKNIK